MNKATINDVAEHSGVSIKTVSRVMNNEPNVRQSTKDKVIEAATALNYKPNPSARGLAGNRSYLIGLLYDNPSPAYVLDVQHGVIDACEEGRYGLLILPCDSMKEKLVEELLGKIEQAHLDGVILTPPLSDHFELQAALSKLNLPFVCISGQTRQKDPSHVFIDEVGAAREVTEHLLALGHRRIAFVQGHPQHSASEQRQQGYSEALSAAGIEPAADYQQQGFFTFESGILAAERLLQLARPPSAVFAANDYMAAGVLNVALSSGLKVPDDLAVAGFDEAPVSSQLWPGLTTYRQPVKPMGRRAAQLLLQKINGDDRLDRQLPFLGELLVRGSTAVGVLVH